MSFAQTAIRFAELGLMPDAIIRAGIRNLSRARLKQIADGDCENAAEIKQRFISQMDNAPIALVPELANAQHYEIPAEFYAYTLGIHRKYSSCYWAPGTQTLDQAEQLALEISCEHADLSDGQQVLELGCGWGSLTLFMAARYPESRITAVSNSHSQREYITRTAAERGLHNVSVITCDLNNFKPEEVFDRVVSVEMFEHMRNHRALLGRIGEWLKPGGKFFMHIFCHRSTPYLFEAVDDDDWMSRFFFSGGMMPSDDLPYHFQQALKLEQHWRWDGTHYEKTANAWLVNMDNNIESIQPVLEQTYGAADANLWRVRWRIFFMACAELFGYRNGQEWWVSHYRFERP